MALLATYYQPVLDDPAFTNVWTLYSPVPVYLGEVRAKLLRQENIDDEAIAQRGEVQLLSQVPLGAPAVGYVSRAGAWYEVVRTEPVAGSEAGEQVDWRSTRYTLRSLSPANVDDARTIQLLEDSDLGLAYEYREPLRTAAMTDIYAPSHGGAVSKPRIETARLPKQTTDADYGYTEFVLFDTDAVVPDVGDSIGGPGVGAFRFDYSGQIVFELAQSAQWSYLYPLVWLKTIHKANAVKGLPAELVSYRVHEQQTIYIPSGRSREVHVDLAAFSGEVMLPHEVDGTIGITLSMGIALWDGYGVAYDVEQRSNDFALNLRVRHDPRQPAVATNVEGIAIAALPAAAERPLRDTSIGVHLTDAELYYYSHRRVMA